MQDSHLEFEPTYDPLNPPVLAIYQPWPEIARIPLNTMRQGSVGEGEPSETRYVPSNEKKEQVTEHAPRGAEPGTQKPAHPTPCQIRRPAGRTA